MNEPKAVVGNGARLWQTINGVLVILLGVGIVGLVVMYGDVRGACKDTRDNRSSITSLETRMLDYERRQSESLIEINDRLARIDGKLEISAGR